MFRADALNTSDLRLVGCDMRDLAELERKLVAAGLDFGYAANGLGNQGR